MGEVQMLAYTPGNESMLRRCCYFVAGLLNDINRNNREPGQIPVIPAKVIAAANS